MQENILQVSGRSNAMKAIRVGYRSGGNALRLLGRGNI
jgi:hypothetical protein